MNLIATCGCGKQFQAQAHLAGRLVRCPSCGGTLTVPRAPVPASPPAAPTPSPQRIVVTCPCGQQLAAPPQLVGKLAPCPRCGQLIPVRPPALSQAAQQIPMQPYDDFWDQIPLDPAPTPSHQMMVEEEAPKQEMLTGNKAVAYAIDQVSQGESVRDIRQDLISRGANEAEADRVLQTVLGDSPKVRRANKAARSAGLARGLQHLFVGGFICLIGIGVTVGSYVAAEPGGVFLLAWGPVVFGGLEAIYGFGVLLGGGD